MLGIGTGRGSLAITLALFGYKVSTGEPADDETIYANQGWYENAKKINVDHMIEFKAFDAIVTPFVEKRFEAIFSLGTFHHIDNNNRLNVLRELLRITKPKAIEMIRESDPTHPDSANPDKYIKNLGLTSRKIPGISFDGIILEKI